MLSVFGFGYLPPMRIHDKLLSMISENPKLSLKVVQTPTVLHNAHLLMFLSVKDFLTYQRVFFKQKSVAIVFDSALHLSEVANINILDSEILPAGILFKQKLLKKKDLKNIIKSTKLTDTVNNGNKYRNVINDLIEINIKDRFLNPYTEFLYSVVSGVTRASYKSLTLAYLYGNIDRKTFDKKIRASFKRKVSKPLSSYEALLKYLDSDVGANFVTALRECVSITDNKAFDTVALKYKVDAYELRYLERLRCNQTTEQQAKHVKK